MMSKKRGFAVIKPQPEVAIDGSKVLDLEGLRLDNQDFFKVADAMGGSKKPYDVSIIVGFDSEYCPDEADSRKNRLLSVQLAYSTPWESGRLLLLFSEGKRPTFRQLAKEVIRALTFPEGVKASRIHLILIAHNAVAEWAHMADRADKDVMKRLALIRKTVLTAHPLQYRVSAQSKVFITLYDTMLLAPESRKKLEKLARLLGDRAPRKISIPRRYIKRMDLLLKHYRDLFVRYAMRDADLCLALFFVLQRQTNMLVFGKMQKFFRTLASPTVEMFLLQNPWFASYRKVLQSAGFASAMELAKNAYHGGLNDCYFVGRTERELLSENYLFFDFDFRNAYPTALALCAKLDINRIPEVLHLLYLLDEKSEAALLDQNVPIAVIDKVRKALEESQDAFETLLAKDTRCRRVAKRIRYYCAVHHEKHLGEWRKIWEAARQLPETDSGHVHIAGFAHVRYCFPEGTLFPTLFHTHPDYGLVYTREGTGTFTASEILFAEDAGADITVLSSANFPNEHDAAGKPIFTFRDFVADLIRLRAENTALKTDAGKATAEILKTFANSAYGKIAQGINYRPVYRPSAGCTVPIDYSDITEPVTAALVTGGIRVALCSALFAVEQCNQARSQQDLPPLVLISATTDGYLLGIPVPADVSAEGFYVPEEGGLELPKSVSLRPESHLKRFGCMDFVALLNQQVPSIQLRSSRYYVALAGDPEPLEIKKIVDTVISIKTRGQVGQFKSGDTPLLAKCGHRVPEDCLVDHPDDDLPTGVERNNREAQWLIKHMDRREASYGED